jgi:N-acetylneuraminic acid mutarotase
LILSPVIALLVSGTACEPDPGRWRGRPPSSFARQEVSFVYSPSTATFLLAGGRSTVQESYDPSTRAWKTVAPLPAALDHVQSVELDGLVYYVGGLLGWPVPVSRFVYVYNPRTDRVTTAAPMLPGRKRGAGGIAVHGGKIYVAGGLHAGVAVPWFDVYDPATDSWATLPDMPDARDHFQGAVVGDRFYAIGGRHTSIDATVTANDAFEFTSGRWVRGLAPLPTARGGFAVAVLGSEILVIGGEGGGRVFGVVEAYDTVRNSWRTRAPMPTPRHGVQGAVCRADVFVAGGGKVQGADAPTDAFEVFLSGGARACE